MKVALKILHKGKITEFDLGLNGILTVGRSSKNDIPVEDEKISGKHCRFFLKHDRLEITDLDSKNGTYLNGIRIEQSEVFIGDQVKLGESLITLEEGKMDNDSVFALTFPGHAKERASYELKIDFTGARIQNQLSNKHNPLPGHSQSLASHGAEIDLRKKVKSKLKLSKEEIRNRNKTKNFLSYFFDSTLFILTLALPIFVLLKYVPEGTDKDQKLIYFLTLEAAAMGIFALINFKMSKFTFGEKISGIKRIYLRQ